MLTREEIEDRCPLLQTEDLAGAMWVPHDGVCHPYKLTRTLMQIANKKGVFRRKIKALLRLLSVLTQIDGQQHRQSSTPALS